MIRIRQKTEKLGNASRKRFKRTSEQKARRRGQDSWGRLKVNAQSEGNLRALSPRKRAKVLEKLNLKLQRLQRLFNLGWNLRVVWDPGRVRYSAGRRLSGEVRSGTIFIYEESGPESVLLHEFLENALVAELVRPYQKLVNKLIEMFEEDSYKRRDDLIERLCDVMNFEGDEHDTNR